MNKAVHASALQSFLFLVTACSVTRLHLRVQLGVRSCAKMVAEAPSGDLPRGFFRLRSAVRKEGEFREQYLGLDSTAEPEKQFKMRHKLSAAEWLMEPIGDCKNAVTLTAAAEYTPQGWYLATLGRDNHVRLCDLEQESDRIVWLAKAGAKPNLWHFSSMAGIGQEPHAKQLSCCCLTADGSEQLVLGREHSWELVPVSNHCTSAGKLACQAVASWILWQQLLISTWERIHRLSAN
ncbi:hypothetical protein ABBQ38_008222 [Trebouxia sp. C0009 RCD-2024]